ncbi:hypothetical protein PROFUN_11877 [Planoprotostelium fungivorum]|uniref:Uncharacterized protein n=1 Tax=Planoprotostelium fungivorum TaxID=1890364 RepID=A0A2P6N9D8_9EUKA|nr:hypothetical protein PROFUN_11877 [Planoprotostelium fungivorum]
MAEDNHAGSERGRAESRSIKMGEEQMQNLDIRRPSHTHSMELLVATWRSDTTSQEAFTPRRHSGEFSPRRKSPGPQEPTMFDENSFKYLGGTKVLPLWLQQSKSYETEADKSQQPVWLQNSESQTIERKKPPEASVPIEPDSNSAGWFLKMQTLFRPKQSSQEKAKQEFLRMLSKNYG